MKIKEGNSSVLHKDPVSIGTGLLVFIVVFMIDILFVMKAMPFRRQYEEFNDLAGGIYALGYDWGDLFGYGAVNSVFFTPIVYLSFKFTHSITAFYKVILAFCAVLHAFPAYIAVRISLKDLKFRTEHAVALGIIAAYSLPIRATALSHDLFLSFFIWLLVWSCTRAFFAKRRVTLIVFLCLAGLFSAFAVTADIKSIVVIPAIVLWLIICPLEKAKRRLTVPVFLGATVISSAVSLYPAELLLRAMTEKFNLSNILLENTFSSYFDDIIRFFGRVSMHYSLRGFLDLFLCNYWNIALCTCGLSVICLVSIIGKKNSDGSYLYSMKVLSNIIFMIALAVFSMSRIKSAINLHAHNESVSNVYFYEKYFAYIVPLLVFFTLAGLLVKAEYCKKRMIAVIAATALITCYLSLSLFLPGIRNSFNINLWFGPYSSIFVLFTRWPDRQYALLYLIVPVAAITIIIAAAYFSRKKALPVLVALLLFFTQFALSAALKDKDPEDAFSYCNAVTNLEGAAGLCISDLEDIYIDNSSVASACFIQYLYPDVRVHRGLPPKDAESFVILSTESVMSVRNRTRAYDAKYLRVDTDELLVFVDPEFEESLHPPFGRVCEIDDYYEDFVNHVYNNILGRNADGAAFMTWAGALQSGDIRPEDLAPIIMTSEEFANRGLNARGEVLALWGVYLPHSECDYFGVNDLSRQLRTGMTREEAVSYLKQYYEYAKFCESYKFEDDYEEFRSRSFIINVYKACLGRTPGDNEFEDWIVRIEENDMSREEILRFIMGSPEYLDKHKTTFGMICDLWKIYMDEDPDISVARQLAERFPDEYDLSDLIALFEGSMAYEHTMMLYNAD